MEKKIEKKLNQLDEDLRLLLTDLDGYSEKKLNLKPQPNAWSVFQVMHHLTLSEQVSLRYVQKKLSFKPELKKAGIATSLRRSLLKVYLKAPIKVKAPAPVATDMPDIFTFWEVAKAWKQERQALRELLVALPVEVFDKEIYKHPMVGKVTLSTMLDFFQDHFNRHKKQIYRTLNAVDAVKVK